MKTNDQPKQETNGTVRNTDLATQMKVK